MPRALLCTLIAILCLRGAASAAPASQPAKPPAVSELVHDRVEAILDTLEAESDFGAAEKSLDELFDRVIAHAPDKELGAFVEVAYARRLVNQLAGADGRIELLKTLRAHPELARTLAFAMKPEDKPGEVFGVFSKLNHKLEAAKLTKHLDTYDTLIAAVCVVHDIPLERHVNENQVSSPDPLAIYDYYVSNEKQMFYGIRGVPVELLVYVVDTTASVPEMKWALGRYKGNPQVGELYHTIQYDYAHFLTRAPKKVTAAGFNLPNILEHGGVCADQAYFAVSVGKSIGVPATYVRGASAEVSHAWVGYLQSRGKQGWWNFDVGRYAEYKGVRGQVEDPQTRGVIPDAHVSLLSRLIGTTSEQRQAAAAFTDAALRLMAIQDSQGVFTPAPLNEGDTQKRKADSATTLAVLELGLRECPGYLGGWFAVCDFAKSGRMSLEQKKRWAEVLTKMCGQAYPDFTLAILTPMVQSVEDVEQQNKLWDGAFAMFARRPDLAAEVRMSQAAMWEDKGQIARAGRCYEDVINRFANAGPFVIDALEKTEKLLIDAGQDEKVLVLYDQTWAKIQPPGAMAPEFQTQSNWFRVGNLFAAKLEEADKAAQAEVVRKRIVDTLNQINNARAARAR